MAVRMASAEGLPVTPPCCVEEGKMYCDQCGQPLSDQETRCSACGSAGGGSDESVHLPALASTSGSDLPQPSPESIPRGSAPGSGSPWERRSGLSPSQIRGLSRLISTGLADQLRAPLTGDVNASAGATVDALLDRASYDHRFRTELVSAIATRSFGDVARHLDANGWQNPAPEATDPVAHTVSGPDAPSLAEGTLEGLHLRYCDACGTPLVPAALVCGTCGRAAPLPQAAPETTVDASRTASLPPPFSAASTAICRSCPDPKCQGYRAITSAIFCESCGRATMTIPIAGRGHVATTPKPHSVEPGMASPIAARPAWAPARRRWYGNGRRIFYASLWAFYTLAFSAAFFDAAAQGAVGGALGSLALAAATGTYGWRIWTYRSRHLWLLIFF